MKKPITLILLLLFFYQGFSQNKNITIKGSLTDTLDSPLIMATMLLLEKSDSTMVSYTRCEMDGSFKFSDVPKGDFLVKSTYVGYLPQHTPADTRNGEDIDLGQIKMSPMASELMEVVIKAAKAPIKMRGDTVEYDASTFKTPPGSTVEDLLRRLPGIEVQQDGSITADGNDVNRVTVDGKSFFGSDPKAATKNLPAEGISKVQVFDTVTEQEEVTGAKSPNADKTMNLEMKEEFKKGGFGKVIGGVGTEQRAELKGNYNKFNETIQFSLVGVGNNTGRNGLSWNDYQDFMGSGSFNFGNDGDYGFSSGFTRYFVFGGGGNNIESSIQSMFFRGSGNEGLPENYNGGVNFNFDNKKTQLNTIYYYNQQGIDKTTKSEESKFYDDFSSAETADKTNNDVSRGHRTEITFEQEIDSLNTIKFKFDGAIINQDQSINEQLNLSRDSEKISETVNTNDRNTSGSLAKGFFVYRKKFMKKGRSMAVNTTYSATELTDIDIQNSESFFLKQDSTSLINRASTNANTKNLFKWNATYVEPVGKRWSWQTFYNYSDTNEEGDNEIGEIMNDNLENIVVDGFLSRAYDNKILYNRFGSSMRYSFDGLNITVGGAYQRFNLLGSYESRTKEIFGEIDREFVNWIPHVSIDYSPVRNTYLSASFNRNIGPPSITDLQPIVDIRNPLFIRVGNPELVPEISTSYSINGSRNYPLAAVRISMRASVELYENQFTTEEMVDQNLITTRKPINLDGGKSYSGRFDFNFPIVKTKISGNVSLSYNNNQRPSLVNDVENLTTTKSYNPSFRLNITPGNDFTLFANARLGINNTTYDINTSQNQNTRSDRYSLELSTKLFAGFFFNGNFTYQSYVNERFDFNQSIPSINSSIYRYFLEGNKLEARIAVYDLMDQGLSVSQNAYGNSVLQSESNAIGRYFMFSLTYNMRGMKAGVSKNRWF